ncbi:hypothetical protein M422DRAFT_255118 [Sphaerobolus stellatus SS14]|uniref:Uncharacterized protein n=1 Tax=Sphaerobolus stellatus (strain SS14) TaxID=990650 RepID=A0A0C9V4K4_SPHS4|nr:hypothetical protein M422DRAFT_255118 [Sphaerobolus stellatus SS14]
MNEMSANQPIPVAPDTARRVIGADIYRKSIDQLLAIVDEPYNIRLWPITKGQGKWPGKKRPSFNQIGTVLLDEKVGMKTTLPVPSDELQREAAQILVEMGVDGLKLKPIIVNKSKAAATRTLAHQKEELVRKAQVEGTMKPSALADELRARGIDPALSGTFESTTPATGTSAPTGTSTTAALEHVESNMVSSPQLEPPSNTKNINSAQDSTAGGQEGGPAVVLDSGVSIQASDTLMHAEDFPLVAMEIFHKEKQPEDQGEANNVVNGVNRATMVGMEGAAVVKDTNMFSSDTISLEIEQLQVEPRVVNLGMAIGGTEFIQGDPMHNSAWNAPEFIPLQDIAHKSALGINKDEEMSLGYVLRVILTDLRSQISGSEVIELLVRPSKVTEGLLGLDWRLDVAELIGSLQSSGSVIHVHRRPFKVQVPSEDEDDCWTVLLNVKGSQEIAEVIPAISNILISPDAKGINRLKMRLVPCVTAGDTPASSQKRSRDVPEEVGTTEKRMRGSPGIGKAVEHPKEVHDKSSKPLLASKELLAKRKVSSDEETLASIRADIMNREGWKEFINGKGKKLTNPEIVKQVAFADKVVEDYKGVVKDAKGNKITREHVKTVLGYGHSRIAEMCQLHALITHFGPNSPHPNPEVCERLQYIPPQGVAPEGSVDLLAYLRSIV